MRIFLFSCFMFLAISHACLADEAAYLEPGASFLVQGNCPLQIRAADTSRSTATCPGQSATPLDFSYTDGSKESCLYIDNTGSTKSFFVPLNTSWEWKKFKASISSGPLQSNVELVYGCMAKTSQDGCGHAVNLPAARNGFSVKQSGITYTCVAANGCGEWRVSDSKSACPVSGACGNAANMVSKRPVETASLIENGDFSDWPSRIDLTSPVSAGINHANWWYSGPGVGGQIRVTRENATANEVAGLPYFLRTTWLTLGKGDPQWGATFLEWGRVNERPYTAPAINHVTQWAGTRVDMTWCMRFVMAGGPSMSFRPIMWQSFGGGQPFTLNDIFGGAWVPAGPNWHTYRQTFTLPSVAGRIISKYGDDYIGVGFDSSGLMGIVDVANIRLAPHPDSATDQPESEVLADSCITPLMPPLPNPEFDDLCASGTPSIQPALHPQSWSCYGQNGGSTAMCKRGETD